MRKKWIQAKKFIYFVFGCCLCSVGLLFLAACTVAPNFGQVYTVVSAVTLPPGVAIPTPQQEPILTITGKIDATNRNNATLMDHAALEPVGLVEYAMTDLFEKRLVRYRGASYANLPL